VQNAYIPDAYPPLEHLALTSFLALPKAFRFKVFTFSPAKLRSCEAAKLWFLTKRFSPLASYGENETGGPLPSFRGARSLRSLWFLPFGKKKPSFREALGLCLRSEELVPQAKTQRVKPNTLASLMHKVGKNFRPCTYGLCLLVFTLLGFCLLVFTLLGLCLRSFGFYPLVKNQSFAGKGQKGKNQKAKTQSSAGQRPKGA
jgi:hypothetical protein